MYRSAILGRTIWLWRLRAGKRGWPRALEGERCSVSPNQGQRAAHSGPNGLLLLPSPELRMCHSVPHSARAPLFVLLTPHKLNDGHKSGKGNERYLIISLGVDAARRSNFASARVHSLFPGSYNNDAQVLVGAGSRAGTRRARPTHGAPWNVRRGAESWRGLVVGLGANRQRGIVGVWWFAGSVVCRGLETGSARAVSRWDRNGPYPPPAITWCEPCCVRLRRHP